MILCVIAIELPSNVNLTIRIEDKLSFYRFKFNRTTFVTPGAYTRTSHEALQDVVLLVRNVHVILSLPSKIAPTLL